VAGIGRSTAGCFSWSLDAAVAYSLGEDPDHRPPADPLIGCPPHPGPVCDDVVPPALVHVPAEDAAAGSAASEVVLRMVVPDGPENVQGWEWKDVDIRAQVWDPIGGRWAHTWGIRPEEVLPVADGSTDAYFGVNHLDPDSVYRFSTSFCTVAVDSYGEDRANCTCYSEWSELFDGNGFPVRPPDPPGQNLVPPVSQEVEDNFWRPATSDKVSGGDGLGPAWTEVVLDLQGDPLPNPVYMHAGEEWAVMQQGAFAEYGDPRRISEGPHSFAQLKFSLEADENLDGVVDNDYLPGYNFDVRARVRTAGGGRAYVAKLARCWRQFPVPTLQILSVIGQQQVDLGQVPLIDKACEPADADQPCSCRPPLEEYLNPLACGDPAWSAPTPIDPDAPRHPVYLQVEVDDDLYFSAPVITASVAWEDLGLECPEGSDISACPFSCAISVVDDSPNGLEMYSEPGGWGLDAHEGVYRLLLFRAGSRPLSVP
jgi:hypothetical protein